MAKSSRKGDDGNPIVTSGHDGDDPTPRYDLADFHIGPSDTKGGSERIWIRCPPQLFRQIRVIVGSRKFPFRTIGDFARVAFYRLSKDLTAAEKGIPNYISQIDAIRELVYEEEMALEFLTIFDSLNRVCTNFIQQGAIGQARRIAAQTKSRIDAMPEGYWREKYQKELGTRFGHLLEG